MELTVVNQSGASAEKVSASDAVFNRDYNESLVHQVVVAYQANARLGTRAQKGRSEVAKSTRKPWRQKGTGRARAGMASSPLWRGGGKIFPNSPDENFSQKVNRKMYRAAISVIYSQLIREERISVIDSLDLEAPKTKLFVDTLKNLGLSDNSVLVIADQISDNLFLASRNLPRVLVLDPWQVDPVSLVGFKKVVITKTALKQIEENLQ